jgi:hypothetical protein
MHQAQLPTPNARSEREGDESDGLGMIELSPAQVKQIVHAANGDGSHEFNVLANALKAGERGDPRLSRSLLVGLLIYAAFPSDGGSLGVHEIATRLDLTSSTTHRYLATLVAVGLINRDPRTRRYHRADGLPAPS